VQNGQKIFYAPDQVKKSCIVQTDTQKTLASNETMIRSNSKLDEGRKRNEICKVPSRDRPGHVFLPRPGPGPGIFFVPAPAGAGGRGPGIFNITCVWYIRNI